MSAGTCTLCHETGILQSSHLIPRAYYKMAKTFGDRNPNTIVITPKIILKTSKQMQAPLLCGECEGRLSRGGEEWVLRNGWRSDSEFPLQAVLFASTPVFDIREGLAFSTDSIQGVRADKLAYFGASIFWRAAVRRWTAIVGHSIPKLQLGPYEDQLRFFLLGKAPFPVDVVLRVVVSASTVPGSNGLASLPVLSHRRHMYRHYSFIVPGLRFDMLTGRGLARAARQICVVHSPEHVVFMSPSTDRVSREEMARLVERSRRVGQKD